MDTLVKKRGRPLKKEKKKLFPLKGLVTRSMSPNYAMELIYEAPDDIKNVFSMIQSCNKMHSYLNFTPEGVLIICLDHYEKIVISVDMIPARMSFYYCAEPLSIKLPSSEIKSICTIIKKSFSYIKMYIKKGPIKTMKVILYEDHYESKDHIKVSISKIEIPEELLHARSYKYDLSFKLNTGHFKKRLTTYYNDKCKFCAVSYVPYEEELGRESINEDLTLYGDKIIFKYETGEFCSTRSTKYLDHEKIKLKTKVRREITANYALGVVSSVFKTVVSNSVYILLSRVKEHNMCLMFCLNSAGPERTSEDYNYNNGVNDKKYSIIIRLYIRPEL